MPDPTCPLCARDRAGCECADHGEPEAAAFWAAIDAAEHERDLAPAAEAPLVLNARHAEYLPAGNLARVLYEPEWNEDATPAEHADAVRHFGREAGLDADAVEAVLADLGDDVEHYFVVVVQAADRAAAFASLMAALAVTPHGDDDVFDYWPSGVWLALDLAATADERAAVEALVASTCDALGVEPGDLGLSAAAPDPFAPEAIAARVAAAPPVGARVRFPTRFDRFPHFIVEAGATGRVIEASADLYAVELDDVLDGAEEWGNAVQWVITNGDDPAADLDLVPPPGVAAAFAEVEANEAAGLALDAEADERAYRLASLPSAGDLAPEVEAAAQAIYATTRNAILALGEAHAPLVAERVLALMLDAEAAR